MIKVNLLDSVTDRAKGVIAVEEKVANPRMQTMLLAFVVFGLLAAGMLYDYYSTTSARDEQTKKKTALEQVQAQMAAVNKERADLQKKMADIQARIDAIQKLRASQQGPGTVLREIKARFDNAPGLYLKSMSQNGSEIMIKGESPNEAAVTNFAKSLEFSSGLFSNLSIETQREEAKVDSKDAAAAAQDPDAPKPEVVAFTIKCTYGATAPAQPAATKGQAAPSNQLAKN
jgi:Tfp pilus assembly protein PilN